MKVIRAQRLWTLCLGVVCGVTQAQTFPPFNVGTAFTYQGRLDLGGVPVDSDCDFEFSLWDESTGGVQKGATQAHNAVTVDEGLFTAKIDFGVDVVTGEGRWMEIAVRCPAGSGSFSTLSPRIELTPGPHASAMPGLWTQQNVDGSGNAMAAPNLIGGIPLNIVSNGVRGATISGGGGPDDDLAIADVNRVHDNFGTIGGGNSNTAGTDDGLDNAIYATVAGGQGNTASWIGASVGGGFRNSATSTSTTVAGGQDNSATGPHSTIGGGIGNTASASESTVAGGGSNQATDLSSFVGGGVANTANGDHTTVAGGAQNQAGPGFNAAVGGGQLNVASGNDATVPGGQSNVAAGVTSFAAGRRAKANHDGTFVWADGTNADFASTGSNQFLIRAGAGVGIGTASPTAALDVKSSSNTKAIIGDVSPGFNANLITGDMILSNGNSADTEGLFLSAFGGIPQIWAIQTGAAPDPPLTFRTGGAERLRITPSGDVGIGTSAPNGRLSIQNVGASNTVNLLTFSENQDPEFFFESGFAGGGSTGNILKLRTFWGAHPMIWRGDGHVGIGTTAPTTALHVRDALAGNDANPAAYVATIENAARSSGADVLALRGWNFSAGNNFITFFGGTGSTNTAAVGRVEASGSTTVAYVTGGADFAEFLPRRDVEEVLEKGDVVGIYHGMITRDTANADHVAVVSTAPAFLGNMPSKEDEHLYQRVALVGQVPVKIRGAVRAGDLIVPSGLNDGKAVAVAPGDIPPEQMGQVIGKALESCERESAGKISALVGVSFGSPSAAGLIEVLHSNRKRVSDLESRLAKLEGNAGQHGSAPLSAAYVLIALGLGTAGGRLLRRGSTKGGAR